LHKKMSELIKDLIRKRKSIVLFSDKQVENEKLEQIFDSARWAPSSFNEQPWRFIYATKDNTTDYEKFVSVINDHNRIWASKAPVLILSIAKTNHSHNEAENKYAFYDVGQAVATLALQATELGLYLRQMAGFDPAKAKENLDIPEGYEPVSMIALGYPGEVDENTDERLVWKQNHKRTRKPLNEVVKKGTWN